MTAFNFIQLNIPYSRYSLSLHALKDRWDKSGVTWSFRGQTNEKHCQWKKSLWSLFILDNRKWRPFHLKDDNVKIWVEVIIVTLQYAVATVNVFMANGNDINLANTLENYEIVVSFDRINKLDRVTRIGKFYHLFAPWNTTWVHSFYSMDPGACKKMAGIVNKVYCNCYTSHSPQSLCSDKLGSKR